MLTLKEGRGGGIYFLEWNKCLCEKRIVIMIKEIKIATKLNGKWTLWLWPLTYLYCRCRVVKIYAPSSSLLQGKHLPFTPSPLRLNIFAYLWSFCWLNLFL
jgi:hypothetical protein